MIQEKYEQIKFSLSYRNFARSGKYVIIYAMREYFFRAEGKEGEEHGGQSDRGAVLGQGQGGAGGEQAEIRRRLTFHRPEHSGKPDRKSVV